MPLEETQIEKQPVEGDCAFTAIINLFKLHGLQPPTYASLKDGLHVLRSAAPKPRLASKYQAAYAAHEDEPTPVELLNLLGIVAGGFVCQLGVVPYPLWSEPQALLTQHLEAGRNLLLFYSWREPNTGRVIGHVSVADGYDARGYIVLDGQPPLEGVSSTFELEPAQYTAEEIEALRPAYEATHHGSRMVLPFFPVAQAPDNPLGLGAHFIVVEPLGSVLK